MEGTLALWLTDEELDSSKIAHQGNLLFQVVESLPIHGLLASMGRIRQTAPRSRARMVGADMADLPGGAGGLLLRDPKGRKQTSTHRSPPSPTSASGSDAPKLSPQPAHLLS